MQVTVSLTGCQWRQTGSMQATAAAHPHGATRIGSETLVVLRMNWDPSNGTVVVVRSWQAIIGGTPARGHSQKL